MAFQVVFPFGLEGTQRAGKTFRFSTVEGSMDAQSVEVFVCFVAVVTCEFI